jgi:hypothetical protein
VPIKATPKKLSKTYTSSNCWIVLLKTTCKFVLLWETELKVWIRLKCRITVSQELKILRIWRIFKNRSKCLKYNKEFFSKENSRLKCKFNRFQTTLWTLGNRIRLIKSQLILEEQRLQLRISKRNTDRTQIMHPLQITADPTPFWGLN